MKNDLTIDTQNTEIKKIKSGFISIIGRPNVGKSTLLNEIIQKKLSIVTDKPQTTRNQIKGIYNDKDMQIIIIDTPGIHKHNHLLGKQMNHYAFKSTRGVDLILFVFPVNENIKDEDMKILKELAKNNIKIFLILSKIDIVNYNQIDEKILEWSSKFHFSEIIPISSKKKINIKRLLESIKKTLPYSPRYFPKNKFTDQPENFLIKEIIREKILILTSEEVPHSSGVIINDIKEQEKIMKIYASIIVERSSQKKIIVGKNGKMIKRIGIDSREELESIFNIKIFLDLFVKVEEKWRENEQKLKYMGYGKKNQY